MMLIKFTGCNGPRDLMQSTTELERRFMLKTLSVHQEDLIGLI